MRDYEVLDLAIRDEGDAPKADDICYRCAKCGGIIPSLPDGNVGCDCGNIFIDLDFFHLCVEDFAAFQVVRKPRR